MSHRLLPMCCTLTVSRYGSVKQLPDEPEYYTVGSAIFRKGTQILFVSPVELAHVGEEPGWRVRIAVSITPENLNDLTYMEVEALMTLTQFNEYRESVIPTKKEPEEPGQVDRMELLNAEDDD